MPKGIRPTQNLVRKAVFDILGDIEGLSFLELYAGSGAVGLEALSRGVKDLTFVEYNRDCALAIQKNIETLKIKNCRLYQKDAQDAIKALKRNSKTFDIIFLDPPYHNSLATPNPIGWVGVPPSAAKKTLQTLSAYDILAPYGLIVAQHFKKDDLPDALGVLTLFKQKKYGDTLLSFYRKVG
jgi:16S rRNA (guanine(966)-N(2))-methyltransferase RsmD